MGNGRRGAVAVSPGTATHGRSGDDMTRQAARNKARRILERLKGEGVVG